MTVKWSREIIMIQIQYNNQYITRNRATLRNDVMWCQGYSTYSCHPIYHTPIPSCTADEVTLEDGLEFCLAVGAFFLFWGCSCLLLVFKTALRNAVWSYTMPQYYSLMHTATCTKQLSRQCFWQTINVLKNTTLLWICNQAGWSKALHYNIPLLWSVQ